MFDFGLTSTGDLIFVKGKSYKPFKLSFNIAAAKCIKVSFDIDQCSNTIHLPSELNYNGMTVSFDIQERSKDKKALTIEDNEALVQYVKIRLNTALGELPLRTEIGSNLELYKHGPLTDKSFLNKIAQAVKAAVNDLGDNITVQIKPFIDHVYAYKQGVYIFIYKDGELLFQQKI